MTVAPLPDMAMMPLTNGPLTSALGEMMTEERNAAGPRPPAFNRRFRGSEAGKCPRAVAFRVLGVPEDIEIEMSTLIAFETGHGLHDLIQRALITKLGAEIEVPVDWMPELDLGCNLDAVYGKTAVEIKSMKAFAFEISAGLRQRNELAGPKWEHVLQSGLGALAPGLQAKQLHLIYVSKEDGRVAEWIFHVDETLTHLGGTTVREMVTKETDRLRRIGERIDNGELPKAYVPGHGLVMNPPNRTSKAAPWNCRYCAWQPTCAAIGPDVVTIETLKNMGNEKGDADV